MAEEYNQGNPDDDDEMPDLVENGEEAFKEEQELHIADMGVKGRNTSLAEEEKEECEEKQESLEGIATPILQAMGGGAAGGLPQRR